MKKSCGANDLELSGSETVIVIQSFFTILRREEEVGIDL